MARRWRCWAPVVLAAAEAAEAEAATAALSAVRGVAPEDQARPGGLWVAFLAGEGYVKDLRDLMESDRGGQTSRFYLGMNVRHDDGFMQSGIAWPTR